MKPAVTFGIPDEIWSIQYADGHLLPPAADDDGQPSFLCWPTQEAAEAGLKHQFMMDYVDENDMLVVVRLK